MVNQTNGTGTQMTVVKAKFGFDIRKMQLCHNNDLSLTDITSTMQRLFQIKDGNSIHLKYRDEDGDWITIADDNDLILASQENPLFVQVYTDDDEIRSHFTNLNALINEFKVSTKDLSSLIEKLSCGNDDNLQKITEKTIKPQSPVQQKLENDNVAVIKPEQAEFANIPLSNSRAQDPMSQSHGHSQIGEITSQNPSAPTSQLYGGVNPSQQYHMPGLGQPQKPDNYQAQPYGGQPSPYPGVQAPVSQQAQFQSQQPPASSFQHNMYNPTLPPTSMYQQIPQQQNYGPTSQMQPQQPTPPQIPSMMGGPPGSNPFARNTQQGFRPNPY